ncbi:hypothetical protein PLICRDRAFT_50832 [Plicaturopsis crispa FD-325 SS-3]|nr:hypothetical protein PLICRDRAFT_50832 [Plicaturopsis crispa FD-325 SS-3]
MALQTMAALAKLISDSVAKIESHCTEKGVHFPTLDEPFTPESEKPRLDPLVIEAASIISSAAAQLTALVTPAPLQLLNATFQFHIPAAFRVAIETNVVEILREAGPQGLHINEIAAINQTDPGKLGRVLRLLATDHIFTEVSPDVFANNRISSVADTSKPVADILAKPKEKYDGTTGMAAAISHIGDEFFKSSAYLAETFCNPEYAQSYASNKTALNLAFKTDLEFFSWIETPGNEDRLRKFGTAMSVLTKMSPPGAILSGYDWQDLPAGSVVVDVGAGVGSQSLPIAKAFPHLKLVVEDRPAVISRAKEFWDAELPEALPSGRVVFQEQDFFADQKIQQPAVFFIRSTLHDWPDADCIKILTKLRAAAGPQTQLLLIEMLVSHACPDTTAAAQGVPGSTVAAPPAPLLANLGHANLQGYFADLTMLVGYNGEERTLAKFSELLAASGWKLKSVRGRSLSSLARPHLLAVPV